MRPLVHIGVHKTGTSWFQKRVYPRLTTHRLVDRRAIRIAFMCRDAFDFDPVAARGALDLDQASEPAILCEEDLSGILHQGLSSTYVAKEMARRLHATLPEANILIFVRAQPTAALSWYHQYVREGGTASLRRYLLPQRYRFLGKDRPFKIPCFDFAQLDYRGLIETYDRLYGREHVTVLPYEALARDRAAVLARVGALLRTDLQDPGGERVNGAYRSGLLPLLRLANLFTARSLLYKRWLVHVPYWYAARKWLFRQLNRSPLFGPVPRPAAGLDRELRQWIAARFSRSNRWLEQRMDWDLRSLGYPVDPPQEPVDRPAAPRWLAWTRQ
ncbi:hypothetical protein [Rhizorhabdus argentea]|uniref:hypothetical protein n=1 Tax=Rhizorhabdus argentea TaxID=1387174 RepID=UPI0030EF5187